MLGFLPKGLLSIYWGGEKEREKDRERGGGGQRGGGGTSMKEWRAGESNTDLL